MLSFFPKAIQAGDFPTVTVYLSKHYMYVMPLFINLQLRSSLCKYQVNPKIRIKVQQTGCFVVFYCVLVVTSIIKFSYTPNFDIRYLKYKTLEDLK